MKAAKIVHQFTALWASITTSTGCTDKKLKTTCTYQVTK